MMMKEVKIYDDEIYSSPFKEMTFLHLAKSKGVSLDGTFIPKMKKGIIYTTEYSMKGMVTKVRWTEKES